MSRTVTGTIYKPDGSAWVGGVVKFDLAQPFDTSTGVFPRYTVDVTTDNAGALTVSLAVPDSGTAEYNVTKPDGMVYTFFIAAGPATDLQTLAANPGSAVTQNVVQTGIDAHELVVDPHPAMLAGGAFSYAVEQVIDTGIHVLPWGIFQDMNPFTNTAYPYAATIDRAMTVTKWVQTWFVFTTNDGSNYWNIIITALSGTEICHINTYNLGTSQWITTTDTSFTTPNLLTSHQAIYMTCNKIGNPGQLKIFAPVFEVQTHDANP